MRHKAMYFIPGEAGDLSVYGRIVPVGTNIGACSVGNTVGSRLGAVLTRSQDGIRNRLRVIDEIFPKTTPITKL